MQFFVKYVCSEPWTNCINCVEHHGLHENGHLRRAGKLGNRSGLVLVALPTRRSWWWHVSKDRLDDGFKWLHSISWMFRDLWIRLISQSRQEGRKQGHPSKSPVNLDLRQPLQFLLKVPKHVWISRKCKMFVMFYKRFVLPLIVDLPHQLHVARAMIGWFMFLRSTTDQYPASLRSLTKKPQLQSDVLIFKMILLIFPN